MEALIRSVADLFGSNARYVVPAYQRPYVWNEDDQWLPLWEDVERVADSRLDDATEPHFLGAVVIRLEKAPPGGVTEWSVIDGQQRLTTLQVLVSAMADAASTDGLEREARKLRRLNLLPEDDAEGDERFKFWPTTVNRDAFRAVVDPGEDAGEDDPGNTVHEAWDFFRGRVMDYAHGEGADGSQIAERYQALFEAVTGLLSIVTISLKAGDPAQVIFETLNARGTPLLAIDLVKNAVFEGAEREGMSSDAAYDQFWKDGLGDYEYWGQEVRLGRVLAPRSEAFLMHWLAMQLGEIIPSDRLFDIFRRKVLSGGDAIGLARTLNRDAQVWRRFGELADNDPASRFFRAMQGLDTSTMHPVALLLFRADIDPARRLRALEAIESYVVRRLIRGLSTKNYTQLAARLVSSAREDLTRADELIALQLLESQADTYRWPSDEELREHLSAHPMYGWLGQRRLVFLLLSLERAMRSAKTEAFAGIPGNVEIEHIMPRSWAKSWPLPDPEDEEAVEARTRRINLLGNLTLATKSLNSAMSNWAWPQKREELNASLLVMNRELWNEETWNEAAIDRRGSVLTQRILDLWRGPHEFMPADWTPDEAESWPEDAEVSADELRLVLDGASDYLKDLLLLLARRPGERMRFADAEVALGWPRGRLAGVSGGYTVRFKNLAPRRPWHLHLDTDGVWWIWMDAERAVLVSNVTTG